MNKSTKNIMIVGDMREALNKLTDYLGEQIKIEMSQKALKKFQALEKQYDDFYKLPLQERLYESGMSKRPKDL